MGATVPASISGHQGRSLRKSALLVLGRQVSLDEGEGILQTVVPSTIAGPDVLHNEDQPLLSSARPLDA
jgi:hypothetical protein